MPKIAWVLLPLLLYAACIAVLAWRGRTPARLALNVHTSLLLLAYLLSTAGLGVFWVANQQLPVFDWHYLFGYATLLLVSIHLTFNIPVVLRWLRRAPSAPAAARPGGQLVIGKAVAALAALGLVFFVGTRQGASQAPLNWGAGEGAASGPVQAVIRYHEFSSESRASVFTRAPGVEWGSPPPPFKHYPGARYLALERGKPGGATLGEMLRAPAPRQSGMRLADLGELLFLAAGITERRGGNALRAAPSSGALFPSELYVLARRIDGLAPGLYHYDPQRHRLAQLGPLPADSGAPQADAADALVVLTAVFRRTGYKYHNRAYRYAAADAGHLLENLRLAGHRAGMRATLLARFDEAAAARALSVDGVEEGVLAMLALQRGAAGMDAPAAAMLPMQASTSGAAGPVGVTGIVQRATSLRLVRESAPDGSLALPAPAPAVRDVHDTIVKRRSQRRFGARALALEELSSVLADMAQAPQLSGAIRISLVVNRVDGLRPGVYRYLPQHRLLPLRTGQFGAAAQSAALSQDVIGDAAVVLMLSADREQVLAQGARGYRHALIEAGLVGERWLLGAVARDLWACPVGAFYDDEAAALIGEQARRHWVLHFAALGNRP